MRKLLALLARLARLARLRPARPAPHLAPGPKPGDGMTDSDWLRHRAPRRHRDETLSDASMRWLVRLPDEVRPDALCARYPRIVNRLAVLWRDAGLAEHCLDDLLAPQRPERQGFAADVSAELQALTLYNELRLYLADDAAAPAAKPPPQR